MKYEDLTPQNGLRCSMKGEGLTPILGLVFLGSRVIIEVEVIWIAGREAPGCRLEFDVLN